MKLETIDGIFSICRLPDFSRLKQAMSWCFTGKTDQEYSLVCLEQDVPDNVIYEDAGWRAFRIAGTLDLKLIGVLSPITVLLKENQIGIFVISTYDTDYVLVKQQSFEQALSVLQKAGYEIKG